MAIKHEINSGVNVAPVEVVPQQIASELPQLLAADFTEIIIGSNTIDFIRLTSGARAAEVNITSFSTDPAMISLGTLQKIKSQMDTPQEFKVDGKDYCAVSRLSNLRMPDVFTFFADTLENLGLATDVTKITVADNIIRAAEVIQQQGTQGRGLRNNPPKN